MSINKSATIALGLLLGMFSAINPAHAIYARGATFSGAECVVRDSSASYASSVRYDFYGRICNEHTSVDVQVICPLPQEWDNEYGSAAVFAGSVFVNNQFSLGASAWSCTAYSRTATGSAYYYGNMSIEESGAAWHYTYQVNNSITDGHRHLRCVIPDQNENADGKQCLSTFTYNELPL